MLAIPGLWRLGFDQAAWIAIAFGIGTYAIGARVDRRVGLAAAGFMATVAISGVLGAEGERWLTLAREMVIGFAFFAAVLGASALTKLGRALQLVLVGISFVLVVSAAASLLALVTQKLYPFETPLAGLIPDVVASTRLGELTFTDRALGTWSYFLGMIFVRPQGLFLFSTSQAVAQAGAIPILIAAGLWFPRLRWWFWPAAALTLAGLLATTTRMPIAALALSMAIAAIVVVLRRRTLRSRLTGRRVVLLGGIVVLALVVVVVGTGLAAGAIRGLTARSLGPRADLYVATFERWTERPLLGWGTEIDWVEADGAPGSGSSPPSEASLDDAANAPPLGSHSHYLGVLFKQGLVGAGAFLVILWLLVLALRSQAVSRAAAPMLVVAAAATTLIAGITESLWLDPGAALFVALAWGLALAPPIEHPFITFSSESPAAAPIAAS